MLSVRSLQFNRFQCLIFSHTQRILYLLLQFSSVFLEKRSFISLLPIDMIYCFASIIEKFPTGAFSKYVRFYAFWALALALLRSWKLFLFALFRPFLDFCPFILEFVCPFRLLSLYFLENHAKTRSTNMILNLNSDTSEVLPVL